MLKTCLKKDEQDLRQKMAKLNQTSNQFKYGIVVQRSFQDALVTLLFNFNIQAVVIRYSPTYLSKGLSSLIKPFIQNALKYDYSGRPQSELDQFWGKLQGKFDQS